MNGQFKKADWISKTNIYEVNIRQYTEQGTLKAFAAHLPRLKEMGVETLWFMPLTPISIKKRKGSLGSYYACSDYVSINPEFGNSEDLKALVERSHQLGFKIIIDWVANHTGWDHVWTVTNPEYFFRDDITGDFKPPKGMDDIIELDHSNLEMRNAMIQAMAFWITEFDIDGFRCDLASWVRLDFWQAARTELEKKKDLFWFGEYDALENPEYNSVFDASYTWAWMHATEKFFKEKQPANVLTELVAKYDAIDQQGHFPVWFTSNHDENSWNGTEYEKYGNMASALTVMNFSFKGIPLIYSGQELPNHKRLHFFDKDQIEWTDNIELHEFYKLLLYNRKNI
jgi:glycosidase